MKLITDPIAALSQDYLNHYHKIPLQSLWFLVPMPPFVNIGKEAMFVPLNFVLPPSDVESSVMTLMQTVFTKAAAQMGDILYETTHHKLLQEEWVVPRIIVKPAEVFEPLTFCKSWKALGF